MKKCIDNKGCTWDYFIYGFDTIPVGFDKNDFDVTIVSGDIVVGTEGLGRWTKYNSSDFSTKFIPVEEKEPDVKAPYPLPKKLYIDTNDLGVCKYNNQYNYRTFQWFYYKPDMTVFPKWFNKEEIHELDLVVYNYFVYEWESKELRKHTLEDFYQKYIIVKQFENRFNYKVEIEEKDNEEYVYVNPLDVTMWFYELPAEVVKYILQKYGIEDGKIDIQKIYKLENGIK